MNVEEGSQSESLTDGTKIKLDETVHVYFNQCVPLKPFLGAIALTKVEDAPKERRQRQPRTQEKVINYKIPHFWRILDDFLCLGCRSTAAAKKADGYFGGGSKYYSCQACRVHHGLFAKRVQAKREKAHLVLPFCYRSNFFFEFCREYFLCKLSDQRRIRFYQWRY